MDAQTLKKLNRLENNIRRLQLLNYDLTVKNRELLAKNRPQETKIKYLEDLLKKYEKITELKIRVDSLDV